MAAGQNLELARVFSFRTERACDPGLFARVRPELFCKPQDHWLSFSDKRRSCSKVSSMDIDCVAGPEPPGSHRSPARVRHFCDTLSHPATEDRTLNVMQQDHAIRFGYKLSSEEFTANELIRQARAPEERGFAFVQLPGSNSTANQYIGHRGSGEDSRTHKAGFR